MKLLFLTGNLPYPPTDGWKIRVFSLVRGLARRHEVTVVSFMRRIDDALAVEQLRDHGIAVHVLPRESVIHRSRSRRAYSERPRFRSSTIATIV